MFAPPSKSYRFSHPPSTCAQKHGHGDFAVCGQRLRGHVPSKNTSPTALSWISLFEHTDAVRFCPCTMIFVPAPVISQHVRSALEKLPLFAPFSVCQKHGAESFAVCGRRLRGHVPSKNTSPTALSWISLIGSHGCGAFLSLHDGFCVPFDKITGRDGVCYGLLLLRIFLIISSTSCFRCSSCFIAVSMLLMEYTMVE